MGNTYLRPGDAWPATPRRVSWLVQESPEIHGRYEATYRFLCAVNRFKSLWLVVEAPSPDIRRSNCYGARYRFLNGRAARADKQRPTLQPLHSDSFPDGG